MIVELRFDADRPREWMRRLAKRFDDGRTTVQIAWIRTQGPRPAGLQALFELERMLLRNGK
ncbi:MAG: glucosamine inositolphosphorylceramide transferase family protein, partial [Bradyrhizobium sp.]